MCPCSVAQQVALAAEHFATRSRGEVPACLMEVGWGWLVESVVVAVHSAVTMNAESLGRGRRRSVTTILVFFPSVVFGPSRERA